MKEILEREKKLIDYDGEDKVITSWELKEQLKARKHRTEGFRSKRPALDKLIEQFETGELTSISGPTGNGKTLFCQTLTRNFAEQDVPCMWFSYEVPPYQFLNQFGNELPLFYLPHSLKAFREAR